ncbi:MAG: peptidoglycan-associated lipoprotein Pal [Arenicellales bacterium]
MMRRFGTIVLVLFLGVAISGCAASKKKGGSAVEVEDDTTDSTASGIGTGDTTAGEIIVVEENTTDMDDPLGQRVVYFDFDSANLTPEAQRIVEAHAQYLAGNPGMAVVLEGHADERGTREYNLALGERRANAVSQIFQSLGVPADAIRTISYGEERPVSMGQDEGAWSLNRRVEILY